MSSPQRAERALGGALPQAGRGAPSPSDLPPHEARRLRAVARDDADYRSLAARRLAGEPLQYLEGTVQFGPLELAIDDRALVPRPETEGLWEMAVAALGDAGPGTVIVDLCTGSGNLALALQHAFPRAQVYATDTSEDAVALAKENAARTRLGVTFLHGDLFDPLPRKLMGRVDLLVANPPYVAEGDYPALPTDVRREPRQALVAGPDGTETLARIGADAEWWLAVGGWLLAEIGETQSQRALGLFPGLDREVREDLAGRDRYLVARKGASCCG